MAHEKAIAQALDSLWNKSSERNLIRGRLGLPGGVFDVPDRPGYKYVNKGAAGELGQVIARDRIGVANTYNQSVWMRYEFGEYVIQRADAVAGGGGGGGASNLDALTDVTLTTPANGNTLQYNSSTGQWVNVVPAGGAGGAPSPHAHSSVHHTGLLPWAELNKSGSSLNEITTRLHSDLQGMTPNDHHNQAHVLATGTALGADHTISGAAVGEVLRALSATTAAFDVLRHTDLGNILPDQHHAQVHDITGPDHTITGSQFQVVGATATDTLGLLTPSANPGAAAAILRTDANGSITLDGNLLFVDALNNRVGVNVTPGAGPAGGAAALDIRAAATGDITQRIRQIAGQTQRLWRVENTAGQELIVMDSVGNLQSGNPGFVSGLTGWQITPVGNAEFNNIWARGELHATVFVKDEVHATGGSFLVATAGTLHDDAVINSTLVDDDVLVVYSTPAGQGVPLQVVTTSGTFTGNELHVSWIGNFLNINDPPSGPGFYFQPGDIVRSKTEVPTGVTDFWLEINSATQYSGYASYSIIKRSGTDGTLPKGSAVVSYGKQGDGRILMTSDLNYAPYIDVFTTGVNVWTGAAGAVIPRMRMGRLDGIGLPGISGVEQYGMIAGKDLSDANTGYLIASNLQFSLYKVDIRLNNGTNDTGLWTADGNLRIGSNIGADATTGFRVYTTTGGGYNAGDVVIGNTGTGNFLRWNQVSGMLQVVGNLTVSDPGTTVTKTYVDLQDSSYDSLAQGYGSTAQSNSITYSDARRVVGVSGTWTSPATNQVVWASAAVVFANGGSRAIAAPPAPGYFLIGVRTYLYVNLAGVTPMPMLFSTTVATVSGANNVLIAVCDPGDPAAPSAARLASITVVAGSTYVSGGNIFTGSITASNIAAATITGDRIAGNTITADKLITGTITSSYLDPAYVSGVNTGISNAASAAATANTNAGTAQATADDNNKYKLQAVRGSMVVPLLPGGRNAISWGTPDNLTLFYADGTTFTIPDGSLTGLSTAARTYIHYVYGTAVFVATTNLAGLTTTSALIAVFDPGATSADPGSLSIVGGATYISGNNIVTGGILAANIQSGAVTANKIDVDGNIDIAGAGKLTIGNLGNIQTSGKTGYADTTAGVFLGWDAGGVAGYKFGIGDGANYLQWGGSGTSLQLRTTGGLDLFATSTTATVLRFLSGLGNISLRHEADPVRGSRIRSDGNWKFDFEVYATKFIQTGDTLQVQTPRIITNATDTGFAGEICWAVSGGTPYLYVCIATNVWRRVALSGW